MLFNLLWEWFWYSVPIWLKLVGAVIAALAVWRLAGTKWAAVILAVLASALGANAVAKRAWRDKELKDLRDADKLIDRAVRARTKANEAAAKQSDHLRDDDGFRRDD